MGGDLGGTEDEDSECGNSEHIEKLGITSAQARKYTEMLCSSSPYIYMHESHRIEIPVSHLSSAQVGAMLFRGAASGKYMGSTSD